MNKLLTVHYDDLKSNKDLSKEIEAAFGEKGLGIILVKGYPDF